MEETSSGAARFAMVALQVALIMGLMYAFDIEPGSGISRLLPAVFAGFLLHAALPLNYRLKFFLVLGAASIAIVIGPAPAVMVIVLGLVIIGLAHLPIAYWTRVLLLVALGAGFALLRAGFVPTPILSLARALSIRNISSSVFPILGSMFMFRLVIYMYELRHEEGGGRPVRERVPATGWTRIAYFFLPPNACFLLFPIVDYRTFRRTYYDSDAVSIYQKGAWLIFLGFLYLLAYRLVYYLLVPTPEEVHGLLGVVRFTTSSYLVYVRVVGQFHIIIGILCLFGFNLPPAHRFYLLASGFTDFWRRARIDWKDFMVKVFYFPSLMPLQRKWGAARALVLATAGVFVATWILHSYQWFWLQGDFRLTQTDAVFWTVIGGCVTFNSLLETRPGHKEKLAAALTLRSRAGLSLRILGIFVFMSLLWSYWSSPSLSAWLSYMSAARDSGIGAYMLLALCLTVIVVVGVIVQLALERRAPVGSRTSVAAARRQNPRSMWRPALLFGTAVVLMLVRVANAPGIMRLSSVRTALVTTQLNAVDQERADRGYYETLLDEPRSAAGGLLAIGAEDRAGDENDKPAAGGEQPAANIRLLNREFARKTGDFLQYELLPSFSGTFQNHPFHTNRWGMRDDDYALQPPANTYRIALLGSSIEMGSGVSAESTYGSLVEDRLNREGPGAPRRHYEILNFGVGSYSILQNVVVMDRKVPRFSPNAVLLAIHSLEPQPTSRLLREMVRARIDIPYDYLREKITEAGITPDMDDPEIRRRIQPFLADVQRWAYQHIAETCRRAGIPVIALLVPRADLPGGERERMADQARMAENAGMLVIDLSEGYSGVPPQAVRLPGHDPHPNALGHRLLADRLYSALRVNDARLLKLGFTRSE